MTTDLVPADPSVLDASPDPASMMVALVEQARTMLAQATGMEGLADVIEWKSRAEAIRVYTQQKDIGHEAELSAAEIVRLAERRIGELIREGQAAGEIRRRGEREDRVDGKISTVEILGAPGKANSDIYAMTDGVSAEQFEEALGEAKAEGNLGRANVSRKAKRIAGTEDVMDRLLDAVEANPPKPPRNMPIHERAEQIKALASQSYTSPQIADRLGIGADHVRKLARNMDVEIPADAVFGGRFKKFDTNKILAGVVAAAEVPETVLAMIAYSEVDPDLVDEWVSSLTASIKSLTTIRNNLKKELTRDEA